jgi:hypothetical protein
MPSIERLMCIAWPAFLAACVLQGVVFAVVDPVELEWFGRPLPWSRQAIYTAAFFLFWGATGLASLMTVLLSTPRGDRPGA